MTQLPEVEVARKRLEREVVGKRIKSVEVTTASMVTRHRNRPELYKLLEGRKIGSVSRRGTTLLLGLDGDATFVLSMGAGATLTRETAKASPAKGTQMVMVFTTGGAVHYHDAAKGGQLSVVPDTDLPGLPELAVGGIDPLADTFTWHSFSRKLQERAEPLRAILTNEQVILGLGDVYADEVLWSAGLAGARRSDRLSAQEVRRLYRAVLEVVYEAVKQGGAGEALTEPADNDDDEEEGVAFIKVYGRRGQHCPRCRQLIAYEDVAGDGKSYFCPQCQT